MFKSLFAKYFITFVIIILLSFSLIVGVISSIITQYSERAKRDIMETAATSAVAFLQNKMSLDHVVDLRTWLAKEAADVGSMLTVACANTDDLTILLLDADRSVLMAVGKDVCLQKLLVALPRRNPSLEPEFMRGIHEFLQSAVARNIIGVHQIDANPLQVAHRLTHIVAVGITFTYAIDADGEERLAAHENAAVVAHRHATIC